MIGEPAEVALRSAVTFSFMLPDPHQWMQECIQ
jgi:hypothetical protein